MNKLYLCGITSSNNLTNLKEMIDPIIDNIDGLNFTFHYPTDEGATYLENNKKDGKIVYADWCQRHSYSMNHFLFQGNMQYGDYFILLDSMERVSREFIEKAIPDFIKQMKERNLCLLCNYGKGFLFKYDESLEFQGSPHWFTSTFTGGTLNLELPKDLFWNVRSEQRDKWHFIDHYAKYMLYPYGSNHSLLGLEKNGNPKDLFPVRETTRLQFRVYLRDILKIPITVDSLKSYLIDNKDNIPSKMKEFINTEKVWNDFYRFHILNDRNFNDDHDTGNMIKI